MVITLIRLLVQPECRVLLYLSSLCQDLTCFTPGWYGQYPGLPGQGTCRNEVVLTRCEMLGGGGRRRRGLGGRREGDPNLLLGSPDLYLGRLTRAGDAASETPSVALCSALGEQYTPTHRLGRFHFGS